MIRSIHPIMEDRPDLITYFDIFEADDAATYPDHNYPRTISA